MSLLINEYGDVFNENCYSSRHRKPKVSSKSILPDMLKIDLTDSVKQAAELVYGKMGSPVRKDNERKKMVFCCILFAHAELDIICSPRELARKVGINDTSISSYVSKYSMNRVSYHPEQRFYTIGQHAKFLMSKIKFDQKYSQLVIQCAERVSNSKFVDGNIQPDVVAAGIILYISSNLMEVKFHSSYSDKLRSFISCSDKALPDMEISICKFDNIRT